ncbi:MAG: hypothetical protein LBL66_08300, partial [Clostridiales bacterium]|nr:hypothetical protein [Clostridiales bacterium]
ILIAAVTLLLSLSLFACGDKTVKHKVTFYDGTAELFAVEVKDGEKITPAADGKIGENVLPAKTGKDFVGWYRTPALAAAFDFGEAIKEAKSVYAGFRGAYQADAREWGIAGVGKGTVLFTSNYGKSFTAQHKMTKQSAADKNEYKMTLDLFADDVFQFVSSGSYANQRGWKYIAAAAGANFEQQATYVSDAQGYKSNIKVKTGGNYTFTLTTYPADDTADTANDIPNLNPFDTVVFTRNGDTLAEPVSAARDYFIKGNRISGWNNMLDDLHKFEVAEFDTVFTKTIYLAADEQFMLMSRDLDLTAGTAAFDALDIDKRHLDAASQALFNMEGSGNNILCTQAGDYTFTLDLNKDAEKLHVEYAAAERVLEDYYINGTLNGANWDMMAGTDGVFKSAAKLARVGESDNYTITITNVAAGQVFSVNGFKAGSAATGESEANRTGLYDHRFLTASKYFEAVSAADNTVKVKAAGTYAVTINSWSKAVTIVPTDKEFDVYLKGSFQAGWQHNFAEEWQFAPNADDPAILEFTHTFAADDQFLVNTFGAGLIAGNGATVNYGANFINRESLTAELEGASGGGASGNIKVKAAGTYKIQFFTDGENKGKISITKVS